MQIALNNKLPTEEELTALIGQVPLSFEIGSWKEYEENIEWTDLKIVYPNGDVLQSNGYTGLWEILTLTDRWNLCGDALKIAIVDDLIDYFLWYWSEEGDLEEVELYTVDFDPEPETTAYFDKLFADNPPYPDDKK